MLMRHLAARLNGDWNRTGAGQRENQNRSSSPVTFLTWLLGLTARAFACLFVCVSVWERERWLWKRVGVTGRAISRAAFRLAMCRRWQRTNCFNCAMAFPTNQGCVKGCAHFSLSLLPSHVFLSLQEHGDIMKRCDKEKQVTWTTAAQLWKKCLQVSEGSK